MVCKEAFQLQETGSLPLPHHWCQELAINESVVSERPLLMEAGLPPKPQKGKVEEGKVT